MNLNVKLNRRQFMELLGVACAVAALPAMPAVAQEVVAFPGLTGSWGTITHSIVGDNVFASYLVTLAEHTALVDFHFVAGRWENLSLIEFPPFTKSTNLDVVTIDLFGELYETPLAVSYQVIPGDVALFSPGSLTITLEE